MEFPYNTANKYLSAKEQAEVDKFIANEPTPQTEYDNGKEKRIMGRFFLPTGCKTKFTVYGPPYQGGKLYHTPLSSDEFPEGRVYHTGGHCTIPEWNKWLGKSFGAKEIEPPEDTSPLTKLGENKLKAIASGAIPSTVKGRTFMGGNKKVGKKENWVSTIKKSKK